MFEGVRSATQQRVVEEEADRLQATADKLTNIRLHGAKPTGILMGLLPNRWLTTAVVTGLAVTDLLDGRKARAAHEMRGWVKITGGEAKDPEADHKLLKWALRGATVGALRKKHYGTAAANVVCGGVLNWRDRMMDIQRARVDELGLDEKLKKANLASKAKMDVLTIGLALENSPLGENDHVRTFANISVIGGTVLSLVGLIQKKCEIDQAAQFLPRMVGPYTSRGPWPRGRQSPVLTAIQPEHPYVAPHSLN